jgi:hypothetical protein
MTKDEIFNLGQEDLDEAVADAKLHEASTINNGGPPEQQMFLLEWHLGKEVADAYREILYSTEPDNG